MDGYPFRFKHSAAAMLTTVDVKRKNLWGKRTTEHDPSVGNPNPKKRCTREDYFERLPEELLWLMFGYLGLPSMQVLRRVCKLFQLLQMGRFWQTILPNVITFNVTCYDHVLSFYSMVSPVFKKEPGLDLWTVLEPTHFTNLGVFRDKNCTKTNFLLLYYAGFLLWRERNHPRHDQRSDCVFNRCKRFFDACFDEALDEVEKRKGKCYPEDLALRPLLEDLKEIAPLRNFVWCPIYSGDGYYASLYCWSLQEFMIMWGKTHNDPDSTPFELESLCDVKDFLLSSSLTRQNMATLAKTIAEFYRWDCSNTLSDEDAMTYRRTLYVKVARLLQDTPGVPVAPPDTIVGERATAENDEDYAPAWIKELWGAGFDVAIFR